MIIIVDTNIIISACLNRNSELFKLIDSYSIKIDFVISEYVMEEINNHKKRICQKSKVELHIFDNNLNFLLSSLNTLNYQELNKDIIINAKNLTDNIDKKDTIFIAFSIALDSLFWSGDIKLYKALKRKGFANIITTKEFKQIIKGL